MGKKQASALVIQKIKAKELITLCPTTETKAVPPYAMKDVEALAEAIKQSSSHQGDCINRVEEVFKDPEVLCFSFYRPGTIVTLADEKNS